MVSVKTITQLQSKFPGDYTQERKRERKKVRGERKKNGREFGPQLVPSKI
jgi:hypothetical protein